MCTAPGVARAPACSAPAASRCAWSWCPAARRCAPCRRGPAPRRRRPSRRHPARPPRRRQSRRPRCGSRAPAAASSSPSPAPRRRAPCSKSPPQRLPPLTQAAPSPPGARAAAHAAFDASSCRSRVAATKCSQLLARTAPSARPLAVHHSNSAHPPRCRPGRRPRSGSRARERAPGTCQTALHGQVACRPASPDSSATGRAVRACEPLGPRRSKPLVTTLGAVLGDVPAAPSSTPAMGAMPPPRICGRPLASCVLGAAGQGASAPTVNVSHAQPILSRYLAQAVMQHPLPSSALSI